jgi:hypothetical protein
VSNITAERGINDNNFYVFFFKKIHFPAREKKPMISFFYKKKVVEEIKFFSPRNVRSK